MKSPDPLQGQRVLVLGAARQGRALGRWLPDLGARVTLSDARSADQLADVLAEFAHTPVELALGGHPLSLLDGIDVLAVSGGVPLTIPIVQEAFRRGIRVTNDAQLFLERCPAPVIGITGSAGKTTTTALLGEMCRASDRPAFVGGNIGDVLLDDLPRITPGARVVMELSSFQLELVTTSPPIAALLNLTPNHLDRHGTMEAYTAAKAHIFSHQRAEDIAIFGADDPGASALVTQAPGRRALFSLRGPVENGAFLDGDNLVIARGGATEIVCARAELHLRGDHNVLNALAAIALAHAAGVSLDAMRAAIAGFRGVAHRMEPVAEHDGVLWVNDSIATAPERVIAALRSYDQPLVLLAGGRDKKLPWDDFAELAVKQCHAVIAFGEFGPQIAEAVNLAWERASRSARLSRVRVVQTLPEAVAAADLIARPGDVVLLSPGGTSFDAYADFAARGVHFRELVRALREE